MQDHKKSLSRRNFVVGSTGIVSALSVLPFTTSAGAQLAKSKTVMFEHTFLKAKASSRKDLARYIELNWFAMDKAGMEKGIFTSYHLLTAMDESSDWDLVMVVGYPQAEGYSDPKTKETFLQIKAAHKEIQVSGKSLKDLGEIVQHHRLSVWPIPM